MQRFNTRLKALTVAGFITVALITVIANLSFTAQSRSVFDQGPRSAPCVASMCSFL